MPSEMNFNMIFFQVKRTREFYNNIEMLLFKWKFFHHKRIKARKQIQRPSIDWWIWISCCVVCGKLPTWLLQFAKTKMSIYWSIIYFHGKSSIENDVGRGTSIGKKDHRENEEENERLISLNRCFGKHNYALLQ